MYMNHPHRLETHYAMLSYPSYMYACLDQSQQAVPLVRIVLHDMLAYKYCELSLI